LRNHWLWHWLDGYNFCGLEGQLGNAYGEVLRCFYIRNNVWRLRCFSLGSSLCGTRQFGPFLFSQICAFYAR
jgi:hypothetical protein